MIKDDPRWFYLRGRFPLNMTEARLCWLEIVNHLAPENIAEDGDLDGEEQAHKLNDIFKDAELLFTEFECPSDIQSDGEPINQFKGNF